MSSTPTDNHQTTDLIPANVDRQPDRPLATKPQKSAQLKEQLTKPVRDALDELGYDPLEWVVKVAQGKELTTDHPFLSKVRRWYVITRQRMESGHPFTLEQLDDFVTELTHALTDSHVPIEIRSSHMREILQYVYPKLQRSQSSVSGKLELSAKPLTEDEVLMFKDKFEDQF